MLEPMFVEGYILEVEASRILLARNISREDYDAFKASQKSIFESGFYLTYYRYDLADNFKPGDHVVVKTNGIEAMSFPGQAHAMQIDKKEAQ